MLVLSRKKNEEIIAVVGDEIITFKIVEVRGDKVRIGVIASQHIQVHRREVYDSIQKQLRDGTSQSRVPPTDGYKDSGEDIVDDKNSPPSDGKRDRVSDR